jgi:hypothetical protein
MALEAKIAYVVAFIVIVLIVVAIVKAASSDRYKDMTEEEFKPEAQRASLMGSAITGLQRAIDPGHRVEYVEAQKQIEADGTGSGDRPETGQPTQQEKPGEK